MTKDLPDFQSEIVSAAVEATAFRSGLDADKPASPAAGDIWLARDTLILYVCCVAGAWTGFDAAQLVQGTLTLYSNLLGGGYKLTGIGAPTAATDAARKSEVDTVDAKLDDVTQAQPTRAKDTIYQNTSGKIRVVQVNVGGGATGQFFVDVGASSPPGTTIGGKTNLTDGTNITFIVLPDYYYRVREDIATVSIVYWTEWDLH